MGRNLRKLTVVIGAAISLSACTTGSFDPDLRGWIPGALSTSEAASRAVPRPAPDSRGLITFPDYQVVVAHAGETPSSIATRLGLGSDELARYNALPASTALGEGAVLVLPRRVVGGAPKSTAGVSTTGQVSDPFAGQSTSAAAAPAAVQPRQHQVAPGETAWSIARKYGVGVQDLASWNGLPANMSVRVGQRLMIPVAGQRAPNPTAVTTVPGTGSPTPQPPSASEPLPGEKTAPASAPAPATESPNLGATRTSASSGGRFNLPVSGSIIRVYEKGKNDGIDIAAASGSQVKAAGAGTVAAITEDTNGVPIVVMRHDGGLMTVYTGMSGLNVSKGDSVSGGQTIGKAGASGVVHFEVRRGFESVDPEDYLR